MYGDKHFGIGHARGHEKSDTFGPTRDTTGNRNNGEWTSRMKMFHAHTHYNERIDYLVELLRPDLASLMHDAHDEVIKRPGIFPFDELWNSLYTGRAIIVNREAAEHLDRKGVRRAWDIILVAGDYTGGDLWIRNMKLFCPLLPGDLVAFDGTCHRHQVMPYTGSLRISHVYYIHQSVFDELGIDTHLADVYLASIVARMARFDRQPPVMGPVLPPGFNRRRRQLEAAAGNQNARSKQARRK
ncbi:hypothetical protein FRC12_018669 [Ceratobasidium sp. 428]|nr:hypothetical protein FRC12_018669 [Ceratobasidium sp. 428]